MYLISVAFIIIDNIFSRKWNALWYHDGSQKGRLTSSCNLALNQDPRNKEVVSVFNEQPVRSHRADREGQLPPSVGSPVVNVVSSSALSGIFTLFYSFTPKKKRAAD